MMKLFYGTDLSFEDFEKKYGNILRSRAEDAHPGMNITSLYTHLISTGKFYRFFKNSQNLKIKEDEIIPTPQKISELRENKIRNWQIYLARCKFHFNQKPVRAREQ